VPSEQQMKGEEAAGITIPTIERILVPVDRTPLSMKAANYGIHLAEVEPLLSLPPSECPTASYPIASMQIAPFPPVSFLSFPLDLHYQNL
jgi:hypothetical protein